MKVNYSKSFRVKVAREASEAVNAGLEHVIAKKYGIRPWTVERWRDIYLEKGEQGLNSGNVNRTRKSNREKELEKEVADLKEEVEILKKAAAFLANVKRD